MQYRKFLLTAAAAVGFAAGGFLLGRYKHNEFINRYVQQRIENYELGYQPDFTRIVDVDHDGRREIVAIATTLHDEDAIIANERARGFWRTIIILPYKDSGEVATGGNFFVRNRDSAIHGLYTLDINKDGFDEIVLFAEWDGKDHTQIFRYGVHPREYGPLKSPYGPDAALYSPYSGARDAHYSWHEDLSREGILIIANIDQDRQLEVSDTNSTCLLGCDSGASR